MCSSPNLNKVYPPLGPLQSFARLFLHIIQYLYFRIEPYVGDRRDEIYQEKKIFAKNSLAPVCDFP